MTGKRQPGGPGRSRKVRGGSSRKVEEVAKMEGGTPAKQRRNDQARSTGKTNSQRQRRPRKEEVGG